jgi:hypothetical protein
LLLIQEHIFQHSSKNAISQPMYINLSPLFSLETIIPYPNTFTLTPPSPLIPLLPIYHICPNYTKQTPKQPIPYFLPIPPYKTNSRKQVQKQSPPWGSPATHAMPKERETRQPDMMLLYFFLVLVASISHIHQNPYTTPLDKK